MDENEKDVLSDEELSEQEKVANVKEEEHRARIVETLGLEDNDENKELIDKVVEHDKGLRSGYGKLLGKYKTLKGKSAPAPAPAGGKDKPEKYDPEKVRNDIAAEARKIADEDFLDDSDYSDEVKKAIRDEAQRTGKRASFVSKNSDYIKYLLEKEESAKKAAEAADNGAKKGKPGAPHDPSKPLDPRDFDMSTEEGRKAWDEAKAARRKAKQG